METNQVNTSVFITEQIYFVYKEYVIDPCTGLDMQQGHDNYDYISCWKWKFPLSTWKYGGWFNPACVDAQYV